MVLTGIPFIDCIILFHMIFFSYFANNPAWISSSQTIWRNIPCHNTSCSYYTFLSYGNTTTNNHIGCQPAIIFYSNWFLLFKIIKASIFSFLILRSSGKNGCMGVANVTFGPIITLSPICTSHTSKQVKLKIVPILYPLDHITLHLPFFLFLSFLITSSKNFITKLVISEYLISCSYCNNI